MWGTAVLICRVVTREAGRGLRFVYRYHAAYTMAQRFDQTWGQGQLQGCPQAQGFRSPLQSARTATAPPALFSGQGAGSEPPHHQLCHRGRTSPGMPLHDLLSREEEWSTYDAKGAIEFHFGTPPLPKSYWGDAVDAATAYDRKSSGACQWLPIGQYIYVRINHTFAILTGIGPWLSNSRSGGVHAAHDRSSGGRREFGPMRYGTKTQRTSPPSEPDRPAGVNTVRMEQRETDTTPPPGAMRATAIDGPAHSAHILRAPVGGCTVRTYKEIADTVTNREFRKF
ncbi:hypothetical protein EDB84DRAFT_1438123 [Lactarius hengduanensis]|nr:hypothetical protein EDB84DRAFT_1438123 [Lactarius hengduanensis]